MAAVSVNCAAYRALVGSALGEQAASRTLPWQQLQAAKAAGRQLGVAEPGASICGTSFVLSAGHSGQGSHQQAA